MKEFGGKVAEEVAEVDDAGEKADELSQEKIAADSDGKLIGGVK